MSTPNRNDVILTEELIRQGMKAGIGMKGAQARLLGISWPLKTGWLESSIGRLVSSEDFEAFLELKDAKAKKRRRFKRKKPRKNKTQNTPIS